MTEIYVKLNDGFSKNVRTERINPFIELVLDFPEEQQNIARVIGARNYPTDSLIIFNSNSNKENACLISTEEAENFIAEHLQKEGSRVVSFFKTPNGCEERFVWYHPLGSEQDNLQFLLEHLLEYDNKQWHIRNAQCGEWSFENGRLLYRFKETGIALNLTGNSFDVLDYEKALYNSYFKENYEELFNKLIFSIKIESCRKE